MKTIYLHHPIEAKTLKDRPTVMALGYFDGVHKGHQKVILTAKKIAEQLDTTASVMTFHPHPKEILRKPKQEMKYLTPLPDKIKKIEKLGINTLYIVQFSTSFAALTPQQFVDDYLIGLNVIHVVAGFDFTYGSLGKGTMETLPFHARNRLDSTIVPKLEKNDEKVSSTKIRELLMQGNVEEVSNYLGDVYSVKGTVVDGEKRGRTIGFPTANILPSDRYLIPKTGVYAVKMRIHNTLYQGVCNVGYKPTFHNNGELEPTIEVHLFSFDQTIYGEVVEVEWYRHLRDEQKFAGVEQLIEQITADKQQAIDFFASEESQ
ncbi:bifunctional riboflavin kinase/FAD synthetase [Halalkalibacter nanhaiisediminis]|uniref:Riboflavin biosynthesis protein n=1 Tax=Halalkalibacter nanhaiisediminis TaxID=688079 RepID=A0A562QEL8_9BACI|nr:bifunctional riboflavin kinase/FAD synthetase [Halalkalibacter nanhaiisediminis]TWI55205.1 riboflavin kinase/FMN adenylyltransferase [Halalkalibacter nanhaiisediminis]